MVANASTASAHRQLIERLVSNVPTGYDSSDIELPNSKGFDKTGQWLRPTVINQTANNVQAGGDWIRYEGLFVVDTFYEIGGNVANQLGDAEAIAAIFENQRFNGVNCQEALIQVNGSDGSFYNVQVNIDFYYEGKL